MTVFGGVPESLVGKRADMAARVVIGSAIDVHQVLGPGLLESAYEACLCQELQSRDVRFRRQVGIAMNYKGIPVDCAFRADLIVEDSLLVEIKSVEHLGAAQTAQALTYLRLLKLPVCLLLNFNAITMKRGIKRVVNEY